jgi:LmbE family N-acetylglucosaminyl deacetylase
MDKIIYLSPHLDDTVLSCGGLISAQIRAGNRVSVWTIFAGDPPSGKLTPFAQSLHERWKTGRESAAARRLEDVQACGILGAGYRHFDFLDCIYRNDTDGYPVITREEDLFKPMYMGETKLIELLTEKLIKELPKNVHLAAPYGFGNHIDHQLVKRLAGRLNANAWYYADYPYSAANERNQHIWRNMGGDIYQFELALENLGEWQLAVAAYTSQISTFWGSADEMRQKIADYFGTGLGNLLRRIG